MKWTNEVTLEDVQAIYNGPEGKLWELVMGEQVHIGGFNSSKDLAEKAGITKEMEGVDFCCNNGGGMRFLVRYCNVKRMCGVDATHRVVERGKRLVREEGLDDRIQFILADVCDSHLPSDSADFVWGEDAWCYVVDKEKLISEAARIVRPGGLIAFTDWIGGAAGNLTREEAQRYLSFMEFPSILDIQGYRELLEQNGLEVMRAEDTLRFESYLDLYMNMVVRQFTYDLWKLVGFDLQVLVSLAEEFAFMRELAKAGKIAQGIFVARKM